MLLPDDLLRTARDQLGLLARSQVAAHLGGPAADRLLCTTRFLRVRRGVYLVRGSAPHPCQGAVASTLRAGEPAILTGPAALRLLEVEGVSLGTRGAVAIPPGRRLRDVGAPVLRQRDPERSTWRLGHVPVAAPADALLESCLLDPAPEPRRLRLTHDRLRWTGRLQPGSLRERCETLGLDLAAPGIHDLLELDGQRSTGDGERRLGCLLGRFDPAPMAQVWVTPFRCIDWYFQTLLLGIEYQGRLDHDHEHGRQRDRTRASELALLGIRLIYVTAADLEQERPLLGRLLTAITVRAEELGVPAPLLRPARPRPA
ncbi:MAG: hypothetical protein ACLFS9_07765 [Nitriliruptoraceae bacterium]